MQYIPIAEKKSRIIEMINFDEFALATIHRAESKRTLPTESPHGKGDAAEKIAEIVEKIVTVGF